MSSIYKTLQDAATVAADAAEVAGNFQDVPQSLLTIGKDVVCAVYDRNLAALVKIKADVSALASTLTADKAAAQGALNVFAADLDVLIDDLSV